jgi:hypothetical protein
VIGAQQWEVGLQQMGSLPAFSAFPVALVSGIDYCRPQASGSHLALDCLSDSHVPTSHRTCIMWEIAKKCFTGNGRGSQHPGHEAGCEKIPSGK